ncbi:unnamed protein product [Protopolystoma xenopodis]|uniref:Uncharacterized protein n=1 Tax=Protopolystoma xenopodis TaxID=117903 RepID=A0A3S4ZSF7_9PLAT|nr:unnamed protein product [Protopolystoma xenopodis]
MKRYRDFGVIGRPVANSSSTLHVTFRPQLIQILDLDENQQILRANFWADHASLNVVAHSVRLLSDVLLYQIIPQLTFWYLFVVSECDTLINHSLPCESY